MQLDSSAQSTITDANGNFVFNDISDDAHNISILDNNNKKVKTISVSQNADNTIEDIIIELDESEEVAYYIEVEKEAVDKASNFAKIEDNATTAKINKDNETDTLNTNSDTNPKKSPLWWVYLLIIIIIIMVAVIIIKFKERYRKNK